MSQSKEKSELDCSVGQHCKTECHKKSYTKSVTLISVELLSELEKKLIVLRSGVSTDLFLNICDHHKMYYLKKYETYQTFCFDPFQRHKKRITKTLRSVSLEFSNQFNDISKDIIKAIPGQKICNACREEFHKLQKNVDDESFETEEPTDNFQDICEIESTLSKEKALE